jgi:hypothetical protein
MDKFDLALDIISLICDIVIIVCTIKLYEERKHEHSKNP